VLPKWLKHWTNSELRSRTLDALRSDKLIKRHPFKVKLLTEWLDFILQRAADFVVGVSAEDSIRRALHIRQLCQPAAKDRRGKMVDAEKVLRVPTVAVGHFRGT